MGVGEKIRRARLHRGMSQEKVAEASQGKLTTGALSRVEAGKWQPKLTTLETLAHVLDIIVVVDAKGTRVYSGDGSSIAEINEPEGS